MKSSFSYLSDDLVLTILFKLESDPRHWARVACVCTRLSFLVRHICWKHRCTETIPAVSSDLFSSVGGGWASLQKLAVCCPGLIHSGVLLENSDFGLEREIGPDCSHEGLSGGPAQIVHHLGASCSSQLRVEGNGSEVNSERALVSASGADSCSWSLYDDLYSDTVYNASETLENGEVPEIGINGTNTSGQFTVKKREVRTLRSHLASGAWNLSREQGNKLLASRFRDDCLYICDWPGCVHSEDKRNYMLFRGVFKNFKKSKVWRTINDGNRNRIDLNCAFCSCNQTWDLHSAFCLRRVFGYHDDGEPVVRAYVCENGHVSGAWTDWPLYT